MMIRIFFFIVSFFISATGYCQDLFIKGQVLDGKRKQPLANATVYINNTSRGTFTNANGEFMLGPLPPGNYEVVASYVGYEALMYNVQLSTAGYKIRFELDEKENQLRNILIISDETRRKYLELFKLTLLGITSAAKASRIKNIELVQFGATDNKDEFNAFADKELVIENPDLGYRIYFEIVDFMYNKKTGASYFYGYTRFENMRAELRPVWVKRRKQVYEGSTMHFFRSLINKQLEQEGFKVLQITEQKMPAAEKTGQQVIQMNKESGISVNGSVMNLARTVTEDSLLNLYADSVIKVYELLTKDGLRITYKKNTLLKQEIQRNMILMPQPLNGSQAGLRPRERPVLIDAYGRMLTPMRIYYDGVWAYERLANMLPDDYEPGK
jgi:CarboxypepD_reg-like domain